MIATRFFLVLLFFVILAVIRTFPLSAHLSTHIPFDNIPYHLLDPLNNIAILAWYVHALTTDPLNLFNGNIFYPAKSALAFADHLLGGLPIFAPVYLVTGSAVLGYNTVFLLSSALSGFAMFCLTYHWTRAFWPSLVAGTLFGFAPVRFAQISRLQVQNFFWAPFAFIFLDRFLHTGRWRDLGLFGSFYWLQVLSSVYLGYMTTIAAALYAGYHVLVIDRTLLRPAILPKVLAFVAGSVVVLTPVFSHYLRVGREWGISRVMGEMLYSDEFVNRSAEVLNYLSAPSLIAEHYGFFFGAFDILAGVNDKWLFSGLVLPALVCLGSVPRLRSLDPRRVRALRQVLWLIMISAFLLSLGPFLVVLRHRTEIPLPYLFLAHILPGFKALRIPARFVFLAVLAASPLAGFGVVAVCERLQGLLKKNRGIASCLVSVSLIALALLELGLKPLPLAKVPTGEEIPEVYRWLATDGRGPILELPIGLYQEYAYVYYSTTHWLSLVNGNSQGPPTYYEILETVQDLPCPRRAEYLKALGVKLVVVHTDKLRADERSCWSPETRRAGLEMVQAFGPDVVYRVASGAGTSGLQLEIPAPDWLPPAVRVTVGLSLHGAPGRSWRHPEPHELSPLTLSTVHIEWQRPGAVPIRRTAKVLLPLVILPDEPAVVPLSIETPPIPGGYTLRASIPSVKGTGARTVEIREAFYPTSLNAPRLLSASYHSPQVDWPPSINQPGAVLLTLTAENTGQAVWLAEGTGGKGAVRLAWRWLKENQEIPGTAGWTRLAYDVFPGHSYDFAPSIYPPKDPGDYTLQVGLVSEQVAWFSDLDVSLVRLNVKVDHASPCESLDEILANSAPSSADTSRFRMTLDRSRYRQNRDLINVFLKVERLEKPLVADLYLVLRGPDCRIYFFRYGRDLVAYRGGLWPVFWRGVPFPKASNQPYFRIHAFYPIELPPGPYTLHLLFTKPNGTRLLGRASATLRVEL